MPGKASAEVEEVTQFTSDEKDLPQELSDEQVAESLSHFLPTIEALVTYFANNDPLAALNTHVGAAMASSSVMMKIAPTLALPKSQIEFRESVIELSIASVLEVLAMNVDASLNAIGCMSAAVVEKAASTIERLSVYSRLAPDALAKVRSARLRLFCHLVQQIGALPAQIISSLPGVSGYAH